MNIKDARPGDLIELDEVRDHVKVYPSASNNDYEVWKRPSVGLIISTVEQTFDDEMMVIVCGHVGHIGAVDVQKV